MLFLNLAHSIVCFRLLEKNMNKVQNIPRHFQFQHPIFVGCKKRDLRPNWNETVYYCWFEYLKRNTDYLTLLDSGSDSEICRDFGDPRNKTFREWWTENNRGAYLFAEPESDKVIKLNGGDVVTDNPNYLTISFPMTLPREFLKKKLDRFLDDHHNGKAGFRSSLVSNAKYSFKGQPNIKTLKEDLEIYDVYINNPEGDLFELCRVLEWVEYPDKSDKKNHATDYGINKARLNAHLKRKLNRAITAIQATSQGSFPKA